MRAIRYHGQKDFRVDHVDDPEIQEPTDAVIRIERTAICGSDLHLYHGPTMEVGDFTMGHEFLGVIEDVGADVRRFRRGDRVLVSCTIGCGHCAACKTQLCSGCEETTQVGPLTNIFGSPLHQGGQAEGARVPYADNNLFVVPESLTDEQVLFLTDILPTGYMGADLAEVGPGKVAVVFGCGPVGTFAQLGSLLRGAAAVIAVDLDEGRLARAEKRGCIPLDPSKVDLRERVLELTHGRGADCAIEAVGNAKLVLDAIDVVRPGGHVSVIGVCQEDPTIPLLHQGMGKNLTFRSGIVNPQRYIPELMPLIESGRLDPTEIITHRMALDEGVRGYEIFDAHEDDVLKVVLTP